MVSRFKLDHRTAFSPLVTGVALYLMVFFANSAFASSTISAPPKEAFILSADSESFAPTRKQKVEFQFQVVTKGRINFTVHSPEGHPIKNLINNQSYQPGSYKVTWNGQDEKGQVVPDAAWYPKLIWKSGEVQKEDYPANYSGGEVIFDLDFTRKKEKLSYKLPVSGRVLVRAGIKDGPVLKSFGHWVPQPAGRNALRWDGFDDDKVEYIAEREDIWFLAIAYALPKFSVITNGNKKESWVDYRLRNELKVVAPKVEDLSLRRNGIRLEKDYFYPRGMLPRMDARWLKDNIGKHKLQEIQDSSLVKVLVPEQDFWILDHAFYELVFFVDFEFVAEEEQGFMPMTWQVAGDKLTPGRHNLTIQLTDASGYVVSKTLPFIKK